MTKLNNSKTELDECPKPQVQLSPNFPTSSTVTKIRKSLTRRKSLKLIKDAKIKLQKSIDNTRNAYIGDRIMGHRAYMNFENSDDVLMCRANKGSRNACVDLSVPSLIESTILPGSGRLIKLTSKHESPSYADKIKAIYNKYNHGNSSKGNRHISVYPERILDAPMLSTESWNILDWNRKGVLAVALGNAVYLWQSSGGNVNELIKNDDDEFEISCVKWLSDNKNNILAVGTTGGKLSLWKETGIYRNIDTQCNLKITAIACRMNVLSVGYISGLIQHYILNENIALLFDNVHHKKAVHQMRWSSNCAFLAVVSKDGSVSVWHENRLDLTAVALFQENGDGMEDVAWSPTEESVLVYAGGAGNKHLKVMDVVTKTCVRSLNVGHRVGRVFWSEHFSELAATVHDDNSGCRIRLYSDLSLKMVVDMTGHKGDIVCMVPNPVTGILATVGRDESIRLWSCFKDNDQERAGAKKYNQMVFNNGFDRFR